MQQKKRFSKKAIAAGATFGVIVALTVTAFAYWTTTGNGTGSATTGTSTAFTVVQTGNVGPALTPDAVIGTGKIQTVTYTVTNPSGSGVQQLNATTVKIANADGSPWTSVAGCSATDYSVGGAGIGLTYTDPTAVTNLADGGVSTRTVTVQMINDAGVNQNGCKLATVPLYIAAS